MNVVQVILCLRNTTFVSCVGVSFLVFSNSKSCVSCKKVGIVDVERKMSLTLLWELQPTRKDIRNQSHSDLSHHEAKQRECSRTWNSTIFVVDIDSYNQNKQINGGGSCCIRIVQIGWQFTLLMHSPNMNNTHTHTHTHTHICFTWSLHK